MTAEKYVNTVVKHVKCSKGKRREIKQQLLSDISAAEEQGEQTEEILRRMGNAGTLAKEFNENLPETERKIFRRKRIIGIIGIAAVILILLIVFALWFLPKYAELGKSGKFQKQTVEEQLKEVIQKLDDNDFTGLKENATDAMQPVLTEEFMGNAKTQISDDWGSFQSWGSMYLSEVTQQGQTFAVGQATAVYEHVTVTYTISFDEDMKLAGLYMK